MALIKCNECGKEISDTLNTCPNCGIEIKTKKNVVKDNNNNNNKRFDILEIGIIIALSLFTLSMLIINRISIEVIINIVMLWLMFCLFKTKLPILKIITGIVLVIHLIMYFFVSGFSFNLEYFGIFRMLLYFFIKNSIYVVLYLVILKYVKNDIDKNNK